MKKSSENNYWELERSIRNTVNIEKQYDPIRATINSMPGMVRLSKLTGSEPAALKYEYADTLDCDSITIQWKSELSPNDFSTLLSHDYFELCLVLSDSVTTIIEDKVCTFHSGDAFLLNLNILNKIIFDTSSMIYSLSMSKEYLIDWAVSHELKSLKRGKVYQFFVNNLSSEYYNAKEFIEFIYQNSANATSIASRLMNDIFLQLQEKKVGHTYIVYGLILQLFSVLDDPGYYNSTFFNLSSLSEKQTIENVKKYLNEHRQRVSRKEVASQLHYNEIYLNRLFKKCTGESIMTYNRRIYLDEAKHLLTNTNISINKISLRLGFINRTQFYKVFSDYYKCTPQEYRKGEFEF